MAIKSYVITQDVKSPQVFATGQAHRPSRIEFRKFTKGQIVNGEMHLSGGKPSFVMLRGGIMIPATVLKEVVTKEVDLTASFTGDEVKKAPIKTEPTSKMRYIDGMLIGALAGFGAAYIAEKKGWLEQNPEKKYKLWGAALGAAAGLYVVFRFGNKTKIVKKTEEK